MPAVRYRSIPEIKEHLYNAKLRGRGCALLVGAGCSLKAGIPTAGGFVDVIKAKYEHAYQRAEEKTYPKCMAELLLSERRDLIASYVDQAKINWAHLCIGLLMQAGYVDRVLTTNFDLLVVRACAMLGVFPATYDFATSQLLKKADIPDQAVFHLHGQRTGFVLMNTIEDMERHSKLLGPVFEDTGNGRVWMVVGYSGENDPVFEHLAAIPRFDNGLFWIGYGDHEPASHVRERLLAQDKDAFFTKGYDADSFFVSLTRELQLFPPDVVARPFTYLQRALTQVTPFVDPGQTAEDDVMSTPRHWISSAVDQFERPAWEIITRGKALPADGQTAPALLTIAAKYLLMQGRYEQVLTFREDYSATPTAELREVISMAYVMRGNQLLDEAKATTGATADARFADARRMYQCALEINPERHEALHNWGNLLLDLGKRKKGQEAEELFAEAETKYRQALEINPGLYDVFTNWGNLLLDRAKSTSGKRRDDLFSAAEEKYREALRIKPCLPDVLLNWGNLLLDRAKSSTGPAAQDLFERAEEKYRMALSLRPQMPAAFYQWGNVLLDRLKVSSGDAVRECFHAAEHKYRTALEIKPDMYEALNNWGNLLLEQAKRATGADANRLFSEGVEKFRAALALKPDLHEILNNWGNLLLDQAKRNSDVYAQQLFSEAEKRYRAAHDMKPDDADVLVNWGNLLTDWAQTKSGDEASQLLGRAKEKFDGARSVK